MENDNTMNELIEILKYIYIKGSNNANIIYDSNESELSKLNIDDLIFKFNIKYNIYKNSLEEKLNSPEYTKDTLFKEDDLDNFSQLILIWKKNCPKYKIYFNRAEELVNKIKSKNQKISDDIMNIEETDNIKVKGEFNYWQMQKQLLDKNKVIQAQDLALLNDNFGRALASLECIANRYSEIHSNIFNYYNMFGLGETQNLNELKKKALVQTQIFQLGYKDYIKNYKKYEPPKDINLKQIKELLVKWMSYVDEESQIIYQGMLNIISSLNNSVFDKKFRAISQKYRHAKVNPKKISNFAAGIYYYNHQRCQEAKNQYMQKGKITSSLRINKDYREDKNAENLLKYYNNNNFNIQTRDDLK